MNIGFLTSEYPHNNTGSSGGIGTSIKNLADALTELGHRVTVFVYGQAADDEFSDGPIRIAQIQNVRYNGLSWYLTRKKIQNVINKQVIGKQLDIIEAPDWTGITAFMRLKCPLVIKLHGSDTYFCHFDKGRLDSEIFLEKRPRKHRCSHFSKRF